MALPVLNDDTLLIQPEPARWRGLVRREIPATARRFREQIGLPADRPVVMAGHHTLFWHPGILAKYLAADAAAGALGARAAWLVVDQDREEAFDLIYPVRREGGGLGENFRQFIGRLRRAGEPLTLNERAVPGASAALPSVARGVEEITEGMRWQSSAPPYARWQTAALAGLVAPLLRHDPRPPIVYATDLSRTELFAELVARMQADPEACVRAYNAAVEGHPTVGIRPLLADEVQGRWELPLWWLPPGRERRHVYAEDLASIPMEELAPKALMMTGLMRLAGCDLFIHGLGAAGLVEGNTVQEGYDVITGEWLAAWLGRDFSIAPIVMVTASYLLPLLDRPLPTPEQVARAAWLAHRARHDPATLRDSAAGAGKAGLLGQIRAAPREERRAIFGRMQRLLEDYRATHAAELSVLDREAAGARERLADTAIAMDRTWAFPLHQPERIMGLRDRIDAAFGVAR